MKFTVKPKSRVEASSSNYNKRRVVAADEDMFDEDEIDDKFNDTLSDVADTVEDIQDAVDDIDQDDINIETTNNISDHYIAECDSCHGIFISAMIESDQVVSKISGVCPLCEKETDQYVKWVVKDVTDSEDNTKM